MYVKKLKNVSIEINYETPLKQHVLQKSFKKFGFLSKIKADSYITVCVSISYSS